MRPSGGALFGLFAAMTAAIWIVGAWRSLTDMPDPFPTRERVCIDEAHRLAAPPSPPGRPLLSDVGKPYWATWARSEHWPSARAPRDPYPPCMDDDRLYAEARARQRAMFAAWRADAFAQFRPYALAPAYAIPLFLLAGFAFNRRAKAAPPPAPPRRRLRPDPNEGRAPTGPLTTLNTLKARPKPKWAETGETRRMNPAIKPRIGPVGHLAARKGRA